MDRELLLEIGCEELPASWLPALTTQIGDGRRRRSCKTHRLPPEAPVETLQHAAPPHRRASRAFAERQTDLEELVTGPPVSAAFEPDGTPTPAAAGFAREERRRRRRARARRRRRRASTSRSASGSAARRRSTCCPTCSAARCARCRSRSRCAGTRCSRTAAASCCSAVRSAGSCSSTAAASCRSRSRGRRRRRPARCRTCRRAPSPTAIAS